MIKSRSDLGVAFTLSFCPVQRHGQWINKWGQNLSFHVYNEWEERHIRGRNISEVLQLGFKKTLLVKIKARQLNYFNHKNLHLLVKGYAGGKGGGVCKTRGRQYKGGWTASSDGVRKAYMTAPCTCRTGGIANSLQLTFNF